MDITTLIQTMNSYLWGEYVLIPLLCGTGLYFTFRLKFVQLRRFGTAMKQVLGGFNLSGAKASNKDGMSSFQALATAIAAQVGTGNMVGVATALAAGGPGALFWLWVAAFFGMATIFAEAVLAITFKKTDDAGHVVGGPAYYITYGLKCKPLAIFFSIAIIIALGFIGNMVQVNSIADGFSNAFGIPTIVTGIAVAALAGLIFIGGLGRIAAVTEKLVPLMAAAYLIGGFYIMIVNASAFGETMSTVVHCAFSSEAIVGGAVGYSVRSAMRYGIARGLFANEAGMGSTPHAHAVSNVDHPCQQGLAAIFGVLTTVVICSISAFVILQTGVLGSGQTGITLTQSAFTVSLGSFGHSYVAIILFFFAFSTVVGWYFFAEQNVRFLVGSKGVPAFRIIVLCFLVLGATLKVTLVWELADLFNGLMVLPNLIALLGLSKIVAMSLKEFDSPDMQAKLKSLKDGK